MRFLPVLFVLVLAACRPGAEAPEAAEAEVQMDSAALAPEDDALNLLPATSAEVLDYLRESPAAVKVVNFWATWCVPCREEFPELVRVADEYRDRGVEVLFVSADFPEQADEAQEFLREHGVTGTSFIKNEGDDAFISAFSEEWMGELPTTMIYDADDNRVAVWRGKTTYEALSRKADSLLTQR